MLYIHCAAVALKFPHFPPYLINQYTLSTLFVENFLRAVSSHTRCLSLDIWGGHWKSLEVCVAYGDAMFLTHTHSEKADLTSPL